MKNFLLNLLGKGPKETSRQGGQTRESIVSRLCLVSLICAMLLTLGAGNADAVHVGDEGFRFGFTSSRRRWPVHDRHNNWYLFAGRFLI